MGATTANPSGSVDQAGNVAVGGYNWNGYKGWNGSNNVYSFLNTGRSTSRSVDILAVMKWLENSEHWIGNVTLGNVQFGWEITSADGGLNFQVSSYLVSCY